MPLLFAPTIGAALAARHWFLWVRCPACRTTRDIDLRALDRHRDAAVTGLIPSLSCRACRPLAPFAELVRLSRTSRKPSAATVERQRGAPVGQAAARAHRGAPLARRPLAAVGHPQSAQETTHHGLWPRS